MVNIWQGFWEMEMNIHRSQLFWCETQRYCLVLFGIDQIDLWKGCSNGWRRALERDGKVDGRAGKPRAYLGTKFQGWSFGATCSSQIFFSWFVAPFLFGWSHFFTGSGFLTTNFSTILSLKKDFLWCHTLPALEVWWTDPGDELQRIGRFSQEGECRWAVLSKWLRFVESDLWSKKSKRVMSKSMAEPC